MTKKLFFSLLMWPIFATAQKFTLAANSTNPTVAFSIAGLKKLLHAKPGLLIPRTGHQQIGSLA